jgi:ankyrin repeat protein
MHTTPVQFSYSTPQLTAITATPQITAGQGSITAALSMPTDQWIALPKAIWPFIFTKVATASDLLNLRSTCHYLHNVYASISKLDERQRQRNTLIYNLTTPRLHQQLYNKVINRNWGKIALPNPDTEEWTKLLTQPLDPKLRGEDYGVAVIKKLCIVGWDLLLSPQVMNNRLLVDLMRLLVDLARHIQYPEEYVNKLFPQGFDEELFHQLAHIHLDRCIQLVAQYFFIEGNSAVHQFTVRQLELDEATIDQGVINLLRELKIRATPSALYYFSAEGLEISALKVLLKRGCDLEQRDMNGQTALFHACYFCDLYIIDLLLEYGADYTATDDNGNTPLMRACLIDVHLEKVKLLLALPDINVNASNNKGKTALHKTAQKDRPLILRALLKHPDIDVNLRTHKGFSALDYAIEHQRFANLPLLLHHPNIDTRASNYPLISGLYFAIEHGSLLLVESFLHNVRGLDIGMAAFNYAIWRQKDNIADLFLQYMDEQHKRTFLKQASVRAWKNGQRDLELRLHEKYGKQYDLPLYPPKKIEEPEWDRADAAMRRYVDIRDMLYEEYPYEMHRVSYSTP